MKIKAPTVSAMKIRSPTDSAMKIRSPTDSDMKISSPTDSAIKMMSTTDCTIKINVMKPPVGGQTLGRTINFIGKPIDELGPFDEAEEDA